MRDHSPPDPGTHTPGTLRVLWVTNMFDDGSSDGFRGNFVTQQWNSLSARPAIEMDRVVLAQGVGKLDYILANRRVRKQWSNGNYDLVHIHYGLTALSTLLLPRSAPMVVTFYGSDINSRFARFIARMTTKRAKRRIFVSRRMSERWPSQRNVVIPNGIDFEACSPEPSADAREALGIGNESHIVLFAGSSDNPVKGYPVFRDVLDSVRRSDPSAEELILSAPGQPHSQVVRKLNAADCLLFTSLKGTEGSPTVVKEALAVGLPVVSVDVGDVAEMVKDVSPGGVVPWPTSDGSDGYERWISEISDEVVSVLRSNRRSDGRRRRSDIDQESITDRLLRLYRSVVGDQ